MESATPYAIRLLREAVMGESTSNTSMLVLATVENSFDYWFGIVSWKGDGVTEGGEGACYNTISQKNLENQYINTQGSVAFSQNCQLVGKAIKS